jgi:Transposase IS66 family
VVLFTYAPSRTAATLKDLLAGSDGPFRGKLLTDGLELYDIVTESLGLQHFGRLQHCRKYYHKALKVTELPSGRALTRVAMEDYLEVKANIAFDPGDFSKRELSLMDQIATRYRDTLSEKMIDVTHAENGAWDKVWAGGQGNDKAINYRLAVADDDPNREAVLEAAAEHEAIRSALGQ